MAPAPAAARGAALPFAGREREIAALAAALAAGLNVIVEGSYGMGRTALLHEVAARLGAAYRFAFAGFALTPAGICEQCLGCLAGARRLPRRRRRYLAARAALLRAPLADPRPHVLVLDDLGRLTPAKAELIRRLSGCGRFRLAAVCEPFLPAPERLRLCAWLAPARRLTLGPLAPAAARRFFARLDAAYQLSWSPATIRDLARASGGYPLRMQEQAQRELARDGAGVAAALPAAEP